MRKVKEVLRLYLERNLSTEKSLKALGSVEARFMTIWTVLRRPDLVGPFLLIWMKPPWSIVSFLASPIPQRSANASHGVSEQELKKKG